jgi:hypothetical protein
LADRSLEETDGSTSNEVGINGQAEVDYTGVGNTLIGDPLTIDGSTILNGTGWLTFTASSAADRAVVLIASDGATSLSVSNAFRVREDAGDVDKLTFPVQVVNLDSWDVDGDWSADWVFLGGAGQSSVASGGSIGVVSSKATVNAFSTWQLANSATKLPITAGQILRARWTVNGGAAPVADWPAVRMDFFEQQNTENEFMNVSSNGLVPAANASQVYDSFIEPAAELAGGEMNVRFVVVDVDPNQGGTFSLESLSVDGITGLDGLFTTDYVLDAGGDDDFTSVVALNPDGQVTSSANAESFTWTVNTSNPLTAPIAQRNSGIIMAANTLYRVVSTISSSVTQINQPKFSVRAFPADNSIVAVHIDVGNSLEATHMTDAGGKDYSVYLPSTGIDGQELRFSFDVINDDAANRSGAITWERAVIESVPLSNIP